MNSPSYFLGADIGATKTHVLVAASNGQVVGFGEAGPGNHELVGYDGFREALHSATHQALHAAGLELAHIAGAGFGVAGYDWPSQRQPTLDVIATLGLLAPVAAVNDTILGLVAGSSDGWGLAVVSGTGCNCWGWDVSRQRIGRVTGGSLSMGEAAGASELTFKALQSVAHAWTQRGPATALTEKFAQRVGAAGPEDLLEGLMDGRYEIEPGMAPLVFDAAREGDAVAIDVIRWAGGELGELANSVIRQLGFENLEFDVVLTGSMFKGGERLIEPMRHKVHSLAPGARFTRLEVPPVVGAVLLGMEQAGLRPGPQARRTLEISVQPVGASPVVSFVETLT
jgi:N-acetylglucosamine kinase-like BadF-type ATPase